MTEPAIPTPRDASEWVKARQANVLAQLPFSDTQDFDDAKRGFLGTHENAEIISAQGRAVWSLKPYGFLDVEEAPPTVDPSLWRQARLNMHHGLFEVVPGVYQVRGFDLANMTLIEGDAGVIVVDCLTTSEGARAALDLYFEHRGTRPVSAVIFTHTHTDHWGGARGVIGDETDVPVIAPNLFMEWAVSENVIAGPAMLPPRPLSVRAVSGEGSAWPCRLRTRQDFGIRFRRARSSVRPHHGDRRPAHDRRDRVRIPRWRRTRRRPPRCISS